LGKNQQIDKTRDADVGTQFRHPSLYLSFFQNIFENHEIEFFYITRKYVTTVTTNFPPPHSHTRAP
jgi:hypothetical protein